MEHSEAFFQGFQGIRLYCQYWLPEGEARAAMALVHGYNDHSGRYKNLVDPLTAAGYRLYAEDQRGYGRSPGQRAYINRWEEYREDLRAFLEWIRQQESGKALFLYGQSMGGLVVLDYLLHYPQGLSGAITSSPLLLASSKPYLVLLSRVLSGILPKFSVDTETETKALSRDPEVVKAYETDPLLPGVGSARFGAELLNTISWVKAHAGEISIPILILHGDADRIAGVQGTRQVFEAISSNDKTLLIYPGGYHELHNDLTREQVVVDILKWLDRHLEIRSSKS